MYLLLLKGVFRLSSYAEYLLIVDCQVGYFNFWLMYKRGNMLNELISFVESNCTMLNRQDFGSSSASWVTRSKYYWLWLGCGSKREFSNLQAYGWRREVFCLVCFSLWKSRWRLGTSEIFFSFLVLEKGPSVGVQKWKEKKMIGKKCFLLSLCFNCLWILMKKENNLTFPSFLSKLKRFFPNWKERETSL